MTKEQALDYFDLLATPDPAGTQVAVGYNGGTDEFNLVLAGPAGVPGEDLVAMIDEFTWEGFQVEVGVLGEDLTLTVR